MKNVIIAILTLSLISSIVIEKKQENENKQAITSLQSELANKNLQLYTISAEVPLYGPNSHKGPGYYQAKIEFLHDGTSGEIKSLVLLPQTTVRMK